MQSSNSSNRLIKHASIDVEALDPNLRTRCEVWTRVMGYHRPVSSFNIGKKGEFSERKFFEENRDQKAA